MSTSTNTPTTAGDSSTLPSLPSSLQPASDQPGRDLPPHHHGLDPNSAVVTHASLADTRRKEMREDLDVLLSHGSHPHHKPLQKKDEEAWMSGARGKAHVQTVQVDADRPPIVGHVPVLDQKQAQAKKEPTSGGN